MACPSSQKSRCWSWGWNLGLLLTPLFLLGCAEEDQEPEKQAPEEPDGDGQSAGAQTKLPPSVPVPGGWHMVEPSGRVCGDGSPYRFFISMPEGLRDVPPEERTSSVVVGFEPGGACWDYASCTGQAGIRGAANTDGIPEDHALLAQLIVPLFRRAPLNPHTPDWTFVYVPYCTGDIHMGDRVTTYTDEASGDSIEFHHRGRQNTEAVIQWIGEELVSIPQLLLTGCSAGGTGSLVSYHSFRQRLPQVERSYLLSDSGPVFPSDGPSAQLHETVREAWGLEPFLTSLPKPFDPKDFGSINSMLAELYPKDRLSVTFFQRDYNYSLYSYERFFDSPSKQTILDLWWTDTQQLMSLYDRYDNLAYYLPYWRELNDSHCTTLLTSDGSEIEEQEMTLDRFIEQLLNDEEALESYVESPQPGEDE